MKKDTTREKIVPSQKRGTETGARHKVKAKTKEEAQQLFKTAKERLMKIDHWADYSAIAIAETVLTDNKGNKVQRSPQLGDYIRIDLAGPGPRSGDGYDWVRIEEIIDNSFAQGETESFGFRVRPADNPFSTNDETSHFYTSDATSTFMIERKGNTVIASEMGRNEIPNTGTEKVADKVRNAVIATGGMLGLSVAQWKLLMRGILTIKE